EGKEEEKYRKEGGPDVKGTEGMMEWATRVHLGGLPAARGKGNKDGRGSQKKENFNHWRFLTGNFHCPFSSRFPFFLFQ
ncbi:MAG: hypothetical protein ACE5LX_10285, partial [Nitrospinota bacterium]